MKKRTRLFLALFLIACFVGSAYWWFALPESMRQKFEKIEMGMNQKEVEEILGGTLERLKGPVISVFPQTYNTFFFTTLEGAVLVTFYHEDGKLVQKEWEPNKMTFWEKIRLWL